jgi:hypothetical protein
MHCFNHPTNPAVGICKYCNKGVCPACAADTGHGLACHGLCETEVQTIHEIVSLNKRVVRNAKTSYGRSALFVLFAGLIFIALGVILAASTIMGYLFMVLGLGFIGYAGFTYSLGKRITQQEKP